MLYPLWTRRTTTVYFRCSAVLNLPLYDRLLAKWSVRLGRLSTKSCMQCTLSSCVVYVFQALSALGMNIKENILLTQSCLTCGSLLPCKGKLTHTFSAVK